MLYIILLLQIVVLIYIALNDIKKNLLIHYNLSKTIISFMNLNRLEKIYNLYLLIYKYVNVVLIPLPEEASRFFGGH